MLSRLLHDTNAVCALLLIAACGGPGKDAPATDPAAGIASQQLDARSQALDLRARELELRDRALAQLEDSLNHARVPLSQLYPDLKRAVFLIVAEGRTTISQGTGFFLAPDGTAISNFHVLDGARAAIAVLDDTSQAVISEVMAYDREMDYVIFRLTGTGAAQGFPYLAIAQDMPAIGEEVFAITNPRGLFQTLSTGIISGYRPVASSGARTGRALIQTTAEITHGSSGGPLFNRAGQVIGITSMTAGGEADLNFAINIHDIPLTPYLNGGRDWNQPSGTPNVPLSELRALVSRYYSAVFTGDTSEVRRLYAPLLTRYFSSFNISSTAAIAMNREYLRAAGIVSAHNSLDWTTFRASPLPDNGYLVSFNMDYYLQRRDARKPSAFNLDIFIEVTPDFHIRAIFENILAKR